ncbi:MAG: anhydro-N-acetylmuramic acid kinase [Hyphomicrobiaceae bacterium]|nr:anhydro-N-acetylmuramic acid kinase [Hyphomicrobiaceae bacterium]
MGKLMRAIGLMSGTSMDGIDVALIETDGEAEVTRGPSRTYAYDRDFRRRLADVVASARNLHCRFEARRQFADAEIELTERHADAIVDFVAQTGITRDGIDLIGFHGQTILHKPETRLTVQLGDGPSLAAFVGLPVVYDLRAADVAAGGQGAPLAPVYHRALMAARPERPAAVLNLGGVANITWIGPDERLIAFDTGPGNALLDDWMLKRTGKSFDLDGRAASAGKIDKRVVQFFLDHPFFAALPPKSLDRNAFYWDMIEGLSVEDGAATLVAMTVAAVVRAVDHLPAPPELWVVCGGGRHNEAIMRGLASSVAGQVIAAETAGLDGDSLEAEAWAYLAVRSLRGLPISFPGTTGAPEPMTGGEFAEP